jgi:hypothetical protein
VVTQEASSRLYQRPHEKDIRDTGTDLSSGCPERPPSDQIQLYVDDAAKMRDGEPEYVARGKNADKEKKALFSKVK